MTDKYLIVSTAHGDDIEEDKKIESLLKQKYPQYYEDKTGAGEYLFKDNEEVKKVLKNELGKPALIHSAILSEGEYHFDDEIAEWIEDDSNEIFSNGYDVQNDGVNQETINQYDSVNNIDDNNEFVELMDSFSKNNEPTQNESTQFNLINNQYDDSNNFDFDNMDSTIDEPTQKVNEVDIDQKDYISNQFVQSTQDKLNQMETNNTTDENQVLYEIVHDILPTSDEIIDKLNTNLNVNDTFENPMSTVVRIIHNSTLQQLYSRVEDKIDELYDEKTDGTLDEYRQKLINQPPKILQDLRDETIKLRQFSQEITNDINNINHNYEKDLENYVREVGEKAKLDAERRARQEYVESHPNQTENQIAEYVNSVKDTYDSLEENIDNMKSKASRSLINSFIKDNHHSALSSALRFIKDKQEIERQAQNDIDAINQSTHNAQNYMTTVQPVDNFDYIDQNSYDDEDEDYSDLLPPSDDLDEENINYYDDEMNADEVADSINNIPYEDEDEDENENESHNDELDENQDEELNEDDVNIQQPDEDDESSFEEREELDEDGKKSESGDLDLNSPEFEQDEELNEVDDNNFHINLPEDEESNTDDSELPEDEEDESNGLINNNEEDDSENDLEDDEDEFKSSIKRNIEEEQYIDEEPSLVDELNEKTLDDDKDIESDIMDDMQDVDTGKDLNEISKPEDTSKKGKDKKTKIIMGVVIGLVIAIIIALAAIFVMNEFSGDDEQQQKEEQAAQKKHEAYLKDLKSYMLGTDQVVEMGNQTVKVRISKINQDGSVQATYKDKNDDGEVVNKETTIEKPVIQSALEKQKKNANKKQNKTIDDSITNDDSSKEDKAKEDK